MKVQKLLMIKQVSKFPRKLSANSSKKLQSSQYNFKAFTKA